MRVLGIDCGGEYTGYGVVEMYPAGKLCCLTCGAIKLSPREALPRRLSRIFTQLGEIITEHHPDEVAIEDVFYALNVKSALKLGQVRGVAMLAAAVADLKSPNTLRSPSSLRSSATGAPRSSKCSTWSRVFWNYRSRPSPWTPPTRWPLPFATCTPPGLSAGNARLRDSLPTEAELLA